MLPSGAGRHARPERFQTSGFPLRCTHFEERRSASSQRRRRRRGSTCYLTKVSPISLRRHIKGQQGFFFSPSFSFLTFLPSCITGGSCMNPGPSVVVSIMVSQRSDEKSVAFFWAGGGASLLGAAPGAGRHGRHGRRAHKLVMNSSCSENKELSALIWVRARGRD